MYIDNICATYVTTENNTQASQYQPVNAAEESNTFSEILTDSISETTPPYPVNPGYGAGEINESEGTGNITTCPMDSIPPVIKSQETPATSYLNEYYPITECEVIQSLSNVRHIINNTDMSGKNDIEKYDFIESKFIDKFGSDFMMARNLSLPSSLFYLIGVEFTDTLARHIDNPEAVNRERLYGDKSTDDIQNAIRDKYPNDSDLTNRDLFLMVNEMRNSGVLDSESLRSVGAKNTKRMIDTLSHLRSYIRFSTRDENYNITPMSIEERDKKWLSMMSQRVNFEELLYMYNIWKASGKVDLSEDVASFLVKHIGGDLNEDGYFVLPGGGTDPCYEQMLTLLLNEMDEYDNLVRDRMALIDGTPPTIVIEQPGTDDQPEVSDVPGAGDVPGIDDAPGAEENLDADEAGGDEEFSDSEDKAA